MHKAGERSIWSLQDGMHGQVGKTEWLRNRVGLVVELELSVCIRGFLRRLDHWESNAKGQRTYHVGGFGLIGEALGMRNRHRAADSYGQAKS
jgi:hypothetical protein